MHRPPSLPERLFGHWLMITLTVVLSVAAVLAGIGLFRELSGPRVTVVAVQAHTAPASTEADDAEPDTAGHTADADADPADHAMGVAGGELAAAATSAATPEPRPTTAEPAGAGGVAIAALAVMPSPIAVEQEPSPDVATSTDVATPPEGAASPEIVESPKPGASPDVMVVASPSPEPVVVRLQPTPGPRGAPRGIADAPIVMYHHIGPLPPNPDVFRRDLTVAPATFEKTLEYLADQEIATVTMDDLFEHFAGGPGLPTKSVVLTFDDGYDDAYEYAFQLLKARQMVGTFFITTDFVERPGYLTWDQIREMSEAGMEIAAHSNNHADFTLISPNELRRQLVEPKRILEEQLGHPIRFLAYPAGKYNAAVMAASRAAGYTAAVTVIHGTRHTPALAFELRRVRAHGADTPGQITARITLPGWR